MNVNTNTATLKPILIMAGGTGGHIFPALAVAKELQTHECPVFWLGAPNSMEARLIPEHNIPLRLVNIGALRGKGLKTKLLMPFRLVKAVWQARKIIKDIKPAAVLGFGGFVTGPGGLASYLSGKPLLVHEQNAIAGMTNRYLSKMAKHIYEAFPNSFGDKESVVQVGNPIRKEIAALHSEELSVPTENVLASTKNVLVLGGSQGAKVLNEVVPQAFANDAFKQVDMNLDIKHQAGKKTFAVAKDAYKAAGVQAEVIEFIDDMAAVYKWADLIICRAGALTVSEVTAAGLPAIFVPFPYAVDDHQRLNAESVSSVGGAIVMNESDLTPQRLADELSKLLNDTARLQKMRKVSHGLAKLDAVQIIADQCMHYANQQNMKVAV